MGRKKSYFEVTVGPQMKLSFFFLAFMQIQYLAISQHGEVKNVRLDHTPRDKNGYNLNFSLNYGFLNCDREVHLSFKIDPSQAVTESYRYDGRTYNRTSIDANLFEGIKVEQATISFDIYEGNKMLGRLSHKGVSLSNLVGCLGTTYHMSDYLTYDDKYLLTKIPSLTLRNVTVSEVVVHTTPIENAIRELLAEQEEEQKFQNAFQEAERLTNSGDYDAAKRKYQEAYAIRQVPEIKEQIERIEERESRRTSFGSNNNNSTGTTNNKTRVNISVTTRNSGEEWYKNHKQQSAERIAQINSSTANITQKLNSLIAREIISNQSYQEYQRKINKNTLITTNNPEEILKEYELKLNELEITHQQYEAQKQQELSNYWQNAQSQGSNQYLNEAARSIQSSQLSKRIYEEEQRAKKELKEEKYRAFSRFRDDLIADHREKRDHFLTLAASEANSENELSYFKEARYYQCLITKTRAKFSVHHTEWVENKNDCEIPALSLEENENHYGNYSADQFYQIALRKKRLSAPYYWSWNHLEKGTHDYLDLAINSNPTDIRFWLEKEKIVDDPEAKKSVLEMILQLDPGNSSSQTKLEEVRAFQSALQNDNARALLDYLEKYPSGIYSSQSVAQLKSRAIADYSVDEFVTDLTLDPKTGNFFVFSKNSIFEIDPYNHALIRKSTKAQKGIFKYNRTGEYLYRLHKKTLTVERVADKAVLNTLDKVKYEYGFVPTFTPVSSNLFFTIGDASHSYFYMVEEKRLQPLTTSSGKPIAYLQYLYSPDFESDSLYYFSATDGFVLRNYQKTIIDYEESKKLVGKYIIEAQFHSQGKYLVLLTAKRGLSKITSPYDIYLQVIHTPTGTSVKKIKVDHQEKVHNPWLYHFQLDKTGTFAFTTAFDKKIKVWDLGIK